MANDFSEYVAKTVESKFSAAWKALHPSFRIIWENDRSKPPGESETCVVFSLMDNEDLRKDLGTSVQTHEYTGIISINIMVPIGSGTRKSRQYADEIAVFFRDENEDSIRYRNIRYEKFGEIGSHFVSNISIDCKYRKMYTS